MTQSRFFIMLSCSVRVFSAEQQLLGLLSPNVQVDVVHLGVMKSQRASPKRRKRGCRAFLHWWWMDRCCTSTTVLRWQILKSD